MKGSFVSLFISDCIVQFSSFHAQVKYKVLNTKILQSNYKIFYVNFNFPTIKKDSKVITIISHFRLI